MNTEIALWKSYINIKKSTTYANVLFWILHQYHIIAPSPLPPPPYLPQFNLWQVVFSCGTGYHVDDWEIGLHIIHLFSEWRGLNVHSTLGVCIILYILPRNSTTNQCQFVFSSVHSKLLNCRNMSCQFTLKFLSVFGCTEMHFYALWVRLKTVMTIVVVLFFFLFVLSDWEVLKGEMSSVV